jgi:hypothetical protein
VDGNEAGRLSVNSKEFVKAAGVELMGVKYNSAESPERQVANQADSVYISGHGYDDGSIQTRPNETIKPADVKDAWNAGNVKVVMIGACSALNISGGGKEWAQLDGKVLLGYNGSAPGDAGVAPVRIVNEYFADPATLNPIVAWRNANEKNLAWNACAIDTRGPTKMYYRFEGNFIFGKKWTAVPQDKW